MADDRSLVDQIAELEARGREALARAARMREVQERYEQDIRRLAVGTDVPEVSQSVLPVAPVPTISVQAPRAPRGRRKSVTVPSAANRASPPSVPVTSVPANSAAPIPPTTPSEAAVALRSIPLLSADLYTGIRTELSACALTARQLAQVLRIDDATVEASLKDLRRAGHVYRFEDDDAYIWCIGDVPGEERRLFVERLVNTRHITRAEIIAAIGHPPGDQRPHKKAVKDCDNTLGQLREALPVHMEENIHKVSVYWLVRRDDGKYQTPPAKQDGRLKRAARKTSKGSK